MKEYEQKEKAENVVSEPGVEYVASTISQVPCLSMDVDSEMDLTEEEIEAELKAFFAEQKEQYGDAPVPEGCVTIEEAYQESLKHLEELYAKKKSDINV